MQHQLPRMRDVLLPDRPEITWIPEYPLCSIAVKDFCRNHKATMIKKDEPSVLINFGLAAQQKPEWNDYARFCFALEKGLRQEAFKHLDSFLQTSRLWTLEQKISFVHFLCTGLETYPDSQGICPHPLSTQLLKPTLADWCETGQYNERPFRWYGIYHRSEQHLFKALEINPADDQSRQVLLKWWIHEIYFSLHHLPDGYIGDPAYDKALAEKAKTQIGQLTSTTLQAYWTSILEEDLILLNNYLEWQASGHPDFAQWGLEHHKIVKY